MEFVVAVVGKRKKKQNRDGQQAGKSLFSGLRTPLLFEGNWWAGFGAKQGSIPESPLPPPPFYIRALLEQKDTSRRPRPLPLSFFLFPLRNVQRTKQSRTRTRRDPWSRPHYTRAFSISNRPINKRRPGKDKKFQSGGRRIASLSVLKIEWKEWTAGANGRRERKADSRDHTLLNDNMILVYCWNDKRSSWARTVEEKIRLWSWELSKESRR